MRVYKVKHNDNILIVEAKNKSELIHKLALKNIRLPHFTFERLKYIYK